MNAFAQCLKSEDEDLVGSRIIQSQYPTTIQAFGLLQRNKVQLTMAFFPLYVLLLLMSDTLDMAFLNLLPSLIFNRVNES